MITEDYVSFETAKLLKEKGFDEEVLTYYVYDTESKSYEFRFDDGWDNPNNFPGDCISVPTLQMAMKWLRIKHDIVCAAGLFTDLPEMPPYWSFNILNQSTANVMYEAFDVKCETYEEACEAAIKYCLENLI